MTRHDDLGNEYNSGVALRPRKRRSGGRWMLLLLLLVAAVVWFAPSIVAKTDVRNRIVGWVLPDFPGKVSIGSASAGWMSPIELRDVAVWDSQGQPVARIPRITTTRQLSRLASDFRNLGTFQLYQPEVSIVLTENSSNIEELIRPFLGDEGEASPTSSSAPPAFGLSVTEGKALISDAVTQQTCVVENLELQMQMPSGPPNPMTVNLTADAQYQANRGNLAANINWQQPTQLTASDLGDGHVQLISQGFPLAALQPIWRRTGADLDLQGQLVSNMDCRWRRSESGPELQAKGNVGIQSPQIRMPSVLGNDRIAMQQANATVDATVANNMVSLSSVKIESDIANLQITGSALLDELMTDQTATAKLLDWQSSHQIKIQGQVDVAAAAAQVPETLKLKDGMQITQGQCTLDLDSHVELGQRVLRGTLQTDRIAAVTNGRTVSWDQPVHLAVGGVSSADGLQIQRVDCQSDFLQINGSGTLNQGELKATGDLQKLIAELGQFCDFGDLQLAGRVQASGSWQRQADNRCQGTLNAEVREFAMASSQIPPMQENQLTVSATALATVDAANGLQRIENGTLQVNSGEDRMTAQLTGPVDNPSANATWPLRCQLNGFTETWLARLRPWGVTIPGWEIRSKIGADAMGSFHAEQIELASCNVTLENLNASSSGWLIREPNVQVAGNLNWKAAGNEINCPALTVTSSTVALRAEKVHAVSSPEQTAASGVFAFRGDLARLASWQYSENPPTSRPRGEFQGQAQLITEQGQIKFQGNADVANFVYEQIAAANTAPSQYAANGGNGNRVNQWTPVWSEPNVRVATSGVYQPAADQLSLQQFEITANGMGITAAGSLANLSAKPTADLKGDVSYDLAVIASKLGPKLGPDIQLVGKRRQPFTISGPLAATSLSMTEIAITDQTQLASAAMPVTSIVPVDLSAETTLAWDSIQAYGIQVGPQEIKTKLQQGTVFFSPLALGVAQGQLSITPRLELNTAPMAVVIDQGKVADNIQITPEMCATWLKYIAPALAGAAVAEGQVSMTLQGAHIPVADPMTASVRGAAEIHGAKVQPGPVAQQLLGTIREVATIINKAAPSLNFLEEGQNWLELAPQTIDFQMAEGRVYHRNLEFTSGKIKLRTQGWVGMDQSIGMMAEIPILDEWVEGEKLLASLKGQSLKIPIGGTFAQPQLDRRIIGQLSQQLLGNAAQQMIQGELQKGLQKLLGQ